jgi:bifunctional enzyme CysN/CysC
MLNFALRRAGNIHWQPSTWTRPRGAMKGQKACVPVVHRPVRRRQVDHRQPGREAPARAMGRHTYLLDGDNVRHGLNKDLGFTDGRPRREHPPRRRGGEADGRRRPHRAGHRLHFALPRRARMARALFGRRVHRNLRRHTAGSRRAARPKGLYKKARRGELKNFTGIDSPYEEPDAPEIRIDTTALSADEAAERIIAHLKRLGIISG